MIVPLIAVLNGIGGYMIPTSTLVAISGSGNVVQSITQSNSISASNTGKYGGDFADFNLQLNSASNTADVLLSNHGGTINPLISHKVSNLRQWVSSYKLTILLLSTELSSDTSITIIGIVDLM